MTIMGKKAALKDIIRELNSGGDVEVLKKRFAALTRGALEVTQDVTAIRGLRGERRLLEWDKPAGEGDI